MVRQKNAITAIVTNTSSARVTTRATPADFRYGLPALHHIGMYAYRATFLRRFPSLATGKLEQIESLEQLRAMEHGYRIMVHVTPTHPGAGVDTPEDLERVKSIFAKSKQHGQ